MTDPGALGRRVREAARAVRPDLPVPMTLRLAQVTAHTANAEMTVSLDGGEVTGVRRTGGAWLPPLGGGVWLLGARGDLWALCSTDADVGFSPRFDRSAAQSIADGTDVAVSFDGLDPDPDLFGCWTIGDPTNIYAPASGRYKIDAALFFASNATGHRGAWVETGGVSRARTNTPAVNGTSTQFDVNVPARRISVGVAIQLKVRQTSTAALNLTEAHMSVVYLGP